jgi:hypothetical protein
VFERFKKQKEGDKDKFYRLTQDGAELLLDHIGAARKQQISLEELMLFIPNGNHISWDKVDLDRYPGLAAVKNSGMIGYVAVWVEDSGKNLPFSSNF